MRRVGPGEVLLRGELDGLVCPPRLTGVCSPYASYFVGCMGFWGLGFSWRERQSKMSWTLISIVFSSDCNAGAAKFSE